MTFGRAISTCLSKFIDFEGRASRPEYWWFYLFVFLVSWVVGMVDPTAMIALLVNIGLSVPVFAAGARRLHDTGRSGWLQLLAITIIGLIPLIIWLASKPEEGANRYGPPV